MKKKPEAYKTIGEVAKIVGLINKKSGTVSTHTIRFWETQFKQIKPKILSGKRRYYSNKQIQTIIKHIEKFKLPVVPPHEEPSLPPHRKPPALT